METLMVTPRSKKELAFVVELLQKLDIPSEVVKNGKMSKKKAATQAFLNSLPERMKEVQMHLEGKIELPTWDEVKKSL